MRAAAGVRLVEGRVLAWPTLLVFWSYAVGFLPHGDVVELGLGNLQVASSGWHVLYAAAFILGGTVVSRRSKNPGPPVRGAGFSRPPAGRADRI
ncbi:MAG: hypothetical protein M3237_16130 [Actinomycetota bacterium]|nr:hypothetical protein [Actinomycetota bacterium]